MKSKPKNILSMLVEKYGKEKVVRAYVKALAKTENYGGKK